MDAVTKRWIRNPSDERAAKNGCRVDEARGAYAVWWIERYCRLYEGDDAGKPLRLHGCHQCGDHRLPDLSSSPWDEAAERVALDRARRHCDCVKKGHRIDWQYDSIFRLYAWVKHSEKWKREVRRFRAGSIWVPKKNKKSPTLAANALYLLVGDAEPGQKVFLCAKDGTQARDIAGKHTIEMRASSPALTKATTVNKNKQQITHTRSRSILQPLSSSNARTQDAKHGLNGCVLVDETHTVDGTFMRIVNRAGISRSEPLFLEFSTAGDNPDGYGRKRFEYAQRVLEAAPGYENDELFVAIYAAPQDLSAEDLDADPLKWGYLANPAMGHTVDPDEYLADYRNAKQQGALELASFRMLRLNIWERSSAPWIPTALWLACRDKLEIEDFRGRVAYGGLDLSRTRDMSAFDLIIPADADEEYFLFSWFWLPHRRYDELLHLVPDLTLWRDQGWLEVTPGPVVDYGAIRRRIRELAAIVQIAELAYDPRFAEELTQALAEGLTGEGGATIEEGLGLDRFAFDQSDDNYAAPVEDFERLVRSGKLKHNGHPVLAWQVGHAHVLQRKTTKVKRVVKPPIGPGGGDHLTIDGVVGAIMALARATLGRGQGAGGVEVWD